MPSFYEISQDRYSGLYALYKINCDCFTHFHKKVEILYIVKGSKTVTINNTKKIMNENEICISDCYDFHAYEKGNDEFYQIAILFPHDMLLNYINFMQNKKLKCNFITDTQFCKEMLLPLFEDIAGSAPESGYLLQSKCDYLLSLILNKVGTISRSITIDHSFIENILLYIENNIAGDITLDSLAAHFGYSRYYFSRLFNSNFQTNINDYISLLRLQKTIDTLNTKKCTITDAAMSCGFSSMKTFYRVLKKNYGDISLSKICLKGAIKNYEIQ